MRFGISINGTNTVLRWPGAIPYRVSDAELADGISANAFDQALQRALRRLGSAWRRRPSGSRARASRRAGRATTTPATSSASSGGPISSARWPSPPTPSTSINGADRRGRRPVQRRPAVVGGRGRLDDRLRSAGRRAARDRPRARARPLGDRRDRSLRHRPAADRVGRGDVPDRVSARQPRGPHAAQRRHRRRQRPLSSGERRSAARRPLGSRPQGRARRLRRARGRLRPAQRPDRRRLLDRRRRRRT